MYAISHPAVHGYWSYQRICALILFIFYKAALVAVCQYYFGFLSAFSGQQYFNNPSECCDANAFLAFYFCLVTVVYISLSNYATNLTFNNATLRCF
jgi:hypothetical protein